MHEVVDIAWWRLAFTALCLAVLVLVSRTQALGLERTLVVASLRGTVQLLLVGYALVAIFAVERPELVIATLLVMLAVAARTGMARLPASVPGAPWLAAASLGLGTTLSLVFMSQVVVVTSPWYDPQYLIPFGGMILGNSMNGASLAGERFQDDLRSRRHEIEALLALGFSGPQSVHGSLARSLRAAMIPTVNSFMVAGVVQLPGMMTGQILGGTDPLIAVKYQILIFFLLMTSVAISTLTFLTLLRSRYLTPAHQLRVPAAPATSSPRRRGHGRAG